VKLHKLILAEEKKDGIPVMQTVIYQSLGLFLGQCSAYFKLIFMVLVIVLNVDVLVSDTYRWVLVIFSFFSAKFKKKIAVLFKIIAKFCLVSFCWSSHCKLKTSYNRYPCRRRQVLLPNVKKTLILISNV
jgi:hypothetical protein